MSRTMLRTLLALIPFLAAPVAQAATPEEIDRAIQTGTEFLKRQVIGKLPTDDGQHGAGANALAGLALLESGVTPQDEAMIALAKQVRESSYTQNRTYNIALCLLFLERLGRPADVPLVQMLGARLAVGQRPRGGWSYVCVPEIPEAVVQQLKTRLRIDELTTVPPKSGPATLHPEVERYARGLRRAGADNAEDDGSAVSEDNSNTQFAVLGLWAVRRHGLNVERNLAVVEQRFLASQLPNGGWGYTIGDVARPSMTCAGLLALATGIARRDTMQTAPNAPPPGLTPKANTPRNDPRELAIRRGVLALATTLTSLRGPGLQPNDSGAPYGNGDLYYFWSVERVAVIYNLDRIAGVDWYAVGSEAIVRQQNRDGSWYFRGGQVAGAALALLFLKKADLTKDLRAVKVDQFSELRSGERAPEKGPFATVVPPKSKPTLPMPSLPAPAPDEAAILAADLIKAGDVPWATMLAKFRDEKGAVYTRALVIVATRVEGDRKRSAREALAERLTRMTAATLREMLKDAEAELRRGAVLACAMKDDATHIPDLIERVRDESAVVWPAARAALKSLTGQDFGPAVNASADDRRRSADAWRDWYSRTKK